MHSCKWHTGDLSAVILISDPSCQKWRVTSSKPLQIRITDDLFSLPSYQALFQSCFYSDWLLLFPIGVSVFINALVIVNILAPNAMTIALSEPVAKEIQVPTLNLYFLGDKIMPSGRKCKVILNSILLHPPENNWEAPQDCGQACSFVLEYDGPALQCRNITSDQYHLDHDIINFNAAGPSYLLYWGNATAPPNPFEGKVDARHDLLINYAQIYRGSGPWMTAYPGGGTYCQLWTATYTATFDFSNNTRRISTSIKSYGDVFSQRICDLSDASTEYYCANWLGAAWVIFTNFAAAFQESVPFDGSWTFIEAVLSEALFVRPLFNLETDQNVPPGTPMCYLTVSNLSEAITGRFTNLTVGLIPFGDDVATVNATISMITSVWEYTSWKLWAVYGPAFLFTLPITVYGIYCIHLSNAGMDDKLSNYLLSTRGDDLDEACRKAADFEDLQEVRLMQQKGGIFTVESDVGPPT